MKSSFLTFVFFLFTLNSLASAQDFQKLHFSELKKPILLAQAEGDDAYDPFSDYSEFDEASDEEADINFFRNGRFFVLGFAGGNRIFTENMGKIYGSGPTYGLFMTFFFDLRFAMQAGFFTGDYSYELSTNTGGRRDGNVSMTFLDVSLKYYVNTQNVTRGLAELNPYYIGGISQIYRTRTFSGGNSSRDANMGLNFGAGLEIPLMRKKSFFGIQALYRYFSFKDEGENQPDPITNNPSGITENGDSFDIIGTIGLNF